MIVGIALGLLCIAAAYRLAGALHNAFWRKQEKRYAAELAKTRQVLTARITIPDVWTSAIYTDSIRKQNYARMQAMRSWERGELVGTAQKKEEDE